MNDLGAAADDLPAQVSRETVPVPGTDGVTVITVTGDIDMLTDPLLHKELDEALDQDAAPPVLVDLSGVTFFSSSGIAALAQGRSTARERGVVLELVVEPGSTVDRSLQLMGMAQLLVMHPTRAAALDAVGTAG